MFAAMISRSVSRPKKRTASVAESSNGTSPLYGEPETSVRPDVRPGARKSRARAPRGSSRALRRQRGDASADFFHIVAEVGIEDVDTALRPEAQLDRVRSELDRPRRVMPPLVAPEPAQ